ncbi:MAG TPA: hypothetical protein VIU62_16020 [Chloroflexota bacterium]|jgi:hypothetical protein
MNVIVILCDTLRRDHCGPYHQGRPLNECWSAEAPPWVVPTPNMDRLAARGTVSGPPNRSLRWAVDEGYRISYLVTDHFHLWEQGSGNYHMGYSGTAPVTAAGEPAAVLAQSLPGEVPSLRPRSVPGWLSGGADALLAGANLVERHGDRSK